MMSPRGNPKSHSLGGPKTLNLVHGWKVNNPNVPVPVRLMQRQRSEVDPQNSVASHAYA
jgi:hypothetical protein